MAWIKIEHSTPDKPEVIAMAEMLDIDQDAVFGKLCRLWIWADQTSRSGHAASVTKKFVDTHVRVTGFAEAMRKVGWLSCEKEEIIFPHFERHNGNSSKERALSAERSSRYRHDKTVTDGAPEKRREELIPPISPKGDNSLARQAGQNGHKPRRKTRAERTEDASIAAYKRDSERADKLAAERRREVEAQKLNLNNDE